MTLTHLHFHKLGMLLLFGVLVFSLFWPHRYSYEKTGSTLIRINNWTGQVCTLKPTIVNPIDAALSSPPDIFDKVASERLSWADCN